MSNNFKSSSSILFAQIKLSVWHIAFHGLATPFLVLLFFAYIARAMIISQGIPCVGDYVDSVNNSIFINLLWTPLSVTLIMMTCEQRHTANYLLRIHKRKAVIANQFTTSLIVAAVFSLYLAGTAFVVGGLFTPVAINWSDYSSCFYSSKSYILDISLFRVIMITALKSFLSLMLYSSIAIALSLILKKVFCFLIIFVLSFINIFKLLYQAICSLSGLTGIEEVYMNTPSKIVYFIIFPLIAALAVIIALKLIKRKDFLNA